MSARANPNTWLVMSVFWAGMVGTTLEGQPICVDADATGNNKGPSWAAADTICGLRWRRCELRRLTQLKIDIMLI